MQPTLRGMTPADADAVLALAHETFQDYERRFGLGSSAEPPAAAAAIRHRHLATTDPGGAWVAEAGGRLVGAAEAILREGIWGLSLLVVHPEWQSRGLGRRLLDAALAYGAGARGGIILASRDPRATSAYARAGFDLHPAIALSGRIRQRPAPAPEVRPGRWPHDRPLFDDVSRRVRGAAHGDDVTAALAVGCRLLVHDAGGFALVRDDEVKLLAAADEAIATALLRSALAATGEALTVEAVTGAQQWAVREAVAAGLKPSDSGPLFTRGDVGPMTPYLPSGAFL